MFFNFVEMRKIGVIFFLLIYLFSSTELAELLRLDVLFEHYDEHKDESSQISFSNFLYMHYIDHGIEMVTMIQILIYLSILIHIMKWLTLLFQY